MELYKIYDVMTYSPKQALAFFVASSDITEKNLESLMVSLKEQIKQNYNNNILEKLSSESLKKIKNCWSLTPKQVLAYGYIVFRNVLFEKKDFSEKEITDMFVYVMMLYSPDNAQEQATMYNQLDLQ